MTGPGPDPRDDPGHGRPGGIDDPVPDAEPDLHTFEGEGPFLDFMDAHRQPIERRIAESTDDTLPVGAPAPEGSDTGAGTS